ncbi:MAG: cytochrome c [Sandaracinus sp.]
MSANLPNSLRIGAILLLGLAASAATGCGEASSGELREWQPSDHQLPEGYQEPEGGAVTEVGAGEALYVMHCSGCHGRSGLGDGTQAPPMARVSSLVDPAVQARSDEELARIVAQGQGGFMPAFGEQLAPTGIAAIVRHLRTLPRPGAAADAPQ